MFDAVARGYLSTAAEFLTKAERQHLVFSGKVITFEYRYPVSDGLPGSHTYFKVHREGQISTGAERSSSSSSPLSSRKTK